MESERNHPSAGYYTITLKSSLGKRVLRSNNERAFVISQLQDLLGRRSLLEEPDARHRLGSHIDLLAFSILDEDIRFIVFSIARYSADTFAHLMTARLKAYQSEWQVAPTFRTAPADELRAAITRLPGPFAALNLSVTLHMRHSDWEYDRYSSIGFYLHDRRGDWVHLWRMSRLYENNPETYRRLISVQLKQIGYDDIFPTVQPFVPLSHAL